MKRIAIAFVAACNSYYGLDPTQLVDAPPTDAMPGCDRELVYSRRVKQIIVQRCRDYTTSSDINRALAACTIDSPLRTVYEGLVDQPLAPVTVEAALPGARADMARLAPEGDRAIFHHETGGPGIFSMHERDSTGWKRLYNMPVSVDFDDSIGTPSRRPNAHAFHARPLLGIVDEIVEDPPGSWRLQHSYTSAELGMPYLFGTPLNLSPDGLRLIFQASNSDGFFEVRLARRTNITDRFTAGTRLPDLAGQIDPFITANCGRVYFSGLGSIFFASQIEP